MIYKALDKSYVDLVDIMYISTSSTESLDHAETVEDTPSGIVVLYDKNGNVTGVEISNYSNRTMINNYIEIDAAKPFLIRL